VLHTLAKYEPIISCFRGLINHQLNEAYKFLQAKMVSGFGKTADFFSVL
jgi:hypothetical protein